MVSNTFTTTYYTICIQSYTNSQSSELILGGRVHYAATNDTKEILAYDEPSEDQNNDGEAEVQQVKKVYSS